ncbi:MAG: ROK family transcriptional regulator [Chloroflexi bacterium]|nr:ROK family transcriptional regulator [Chloroflexota bacterium]
MKKGLLRENTLTVNKMHIINQSAILDYIRRQGATSRPSIARDLHFSLPTVMRIVAELIDEGLVISTGEKEFSGGRRRPLLEINSKDNLIVGIDLGGTDIYGAVTDLSGTILVEKKVDNQPAAAEDSYARLVDLIDGLVGNEALSGRRILGLAVGTQGHTNHQDGIVISDPVQNWIDYPLKEKLFTRFNIPVVIDNDVNLAALGELWFGVDQNARNLVFITIGNGIGAGIIIDGSLYRSSNSLAGEIGYFLPNKEYLGTRHGKFGLLESQASLAAIRERAQELLHAQAQAISPEMTTPEGIFKAMLDHQPWAQTLINELVDYLAIAVANTCALLDPDLIVLRSGLDSYTDLLIEPILQRIENLVPIKPRLVASSLGYRATALGAIVEVLYDTNHFYTIRKLR